MNLSFYGLYAVSFQKKMLMSFWILLILLYLLLYFYALRNAKKKQFSN